MDFDAAVGLAAANFAASLAPGQNAALIVSATARGGGRSGAAVLGGVLTAEAIWASLALLATVGLLARIDPAPLSLVGGLALVALGLVSITQRPSPVGAATRPHRAALVGQGAVVGLANPMALAFFVAVFPQFLPAGPLTPETAVAGVTVIVLSSAAGHAPWLCASAGFASPGRTLMLHRGCAAAIIACGISALAAPLWSASAAADLADFGGPG